MILAQAMRFMFSTAKSAFLDGKRAAPADRRHLQSSLETNDFSAFVAMRARVIPTMYATTLAAWFSWFMYAPVIASGRAQLKVLQTIVVSFTVDMMHFFASFQKSTNRLFHYESVFENRAVLATHRMIRAININVSVFGFVFGFGNMKLCRELRHNWI